MILVDTNVLARLVNKSDPQRPSAKAAITRLRDAGEQLVLAPQCLYEFWVIVTRPANENGFGFTASHASHWVSKIRRIGPILPDDLNVCTQWQTLVTTNATLGKKAHDAHLAAWMLVHGVAAVLTFNVKDFQRYGLSVIDPASSPTA